MYCHKCGRLINENENFCSDCSKKMEDELLNPITKSPEIEKYKRISFILGIVSIFGFLLIGLNFIISGLGIFMGYKYKNQTKKHCTGITLSVIGGTLTLITIVIIIFIIL